MTSMLYMPVLVLGIVRVVDLVLEHGLFKMKDIRNQAFNYVNTLSQVD